MNGLQQREQKQELSRAETTFVSPPVDIHETKDEYRLISDMPGVGKADLEVVLDGNELTVTGHRRQVDLNGDYLHRESRRFSYRRTFELDPSIDGARVSAQISEGVLTVRLPKTEAVKPRRIAVAG